MPQFGESITQARIVRWLKKEGESVQEVEPLVEMETEKAVFAYESPFRGKLTKILVKEEAEVAVGTEIAHFEVSEADGKKYLSLGIGKAVGGEVAKVEAPSAAGKGLSPLIRSLAKEQGIPLEEVEKIPGTGPGGRITKEDLLTYVKGRVRPAPAEPAARAGVKTIPLTPIRARIAENMMLSKSKIPHAGCSLDVDLSAIEAWRTGRKEAPGYLSFAILAVIKALRAHPVLNSSWREAEGRRWIEQYDYVHLGIAVSTDQGLMVPVIRNAHTLSLNQIVKEIERLVEAGRKGALTVQELTGATFTVNNAGALGTVRSHQIIPHPQAAILATNRVVRRPWVAGDKVEIRPIMGLDLAFDHRIIDGDVATRFLVTVRDNLEKFDFSEIS
jgi:pyruvate/2-oxoglutarate dehydrogenase complex dihydrolipoamide acyltransferase (E2) component